MHVFLVQRSSEDSSNKQALPAPSLMATGTLPTASVIQQSPSDQGAQMRLEQQQAQPMITQQQLPSPQAGTDQYTVGTTQQQLPPPLTPPPADTDQYTVMALLPESSLSSPALHLSGRHREKRISM